MDTNITLCQVCKSDERELCDGESMGLAMDLVVRCGECDRYGTNLERSLKYFTNKMNDDKMYDTDGRKKISNEVRSCKRRM